MMGVSQGGLEDDGFDAPLLAEINITPFVDVMLVVLVIFMVAAPLMVHGLAVELPSVAAGAVGRPSKPLIVSLARDGRVQVGGETLPVVGLADRLAMLRSTQGDAMVYVRADRGIAYGAVADILAKLGTAGFAHVSLLTQAPVETTAP